LANLFGNCHSVRGARLLDPLAVNFFG
jgi:hypothetical protein